ncbi:hypothetical protein WJX74_002905 [Apatococcus lobatus]|uniref:Fungal-type protein kinase domain-containing protein n=1 Tax=Apatococcus lobatus TaxID=904363 RepID=A0AAW1R0M2_9CHLO
MAGAACIGPPSVWGIFGQMQAATNSSGCLHSSAEYYLSRILSQAHSNATGKAAAKNINDAIPGAVSSLGGGEAEMMLNFRGILLEYFRSQIPHVIPTLEPTSAALESSAESDGAVPVYDSDLGLKLPNILLIEGREDWGKGDGSNPFAQLIAYYAKAVFSRQREPLVKNTVFPAFGLEVFGNNIRVSALFFTDKICAEPLTEHLSMMYLLDSQPERMYHHAHVLHALALGLQDLHSCYTGEAPADLHTHDRSLLCVPWMLLRPQYQKVAHVGLNSRSQTWPCEKKIGSSITSIFAKVTTAPYPSTLHAEAGKAGVVPQLSQKRQKRYPGGQHLVEMEYLDPQHGWISLANFDGDWASARFMLEELLQKWQACCDNKAVHGDLRPPNIFLRLRTHASWTWRGLEGRAAVIQEPLLALRGPHQASGSVSWEEWGPVHCPVLDRFSLVCCAAELWACEDIQAPSSIQADAEAFAS